MAQLYLHNSTALTRPYTGAAAGPLWRELIEYRKLFARERNDEKMVIYRRRGGGWGFEKFLLATGFLLGELWGLYGPRWK